MSALEEVLALVEREGPITFDRYMDVALYGVSGFFATGGGAGRRADFITSPEVGPLFGAVVARAFDAEWERLSRPDPFVVVEVGAGRGALARSVLDARPNCAPALRYLCVERSPVLRDAVAELVPLEPPANVLAVGPSDDEADGPVEPGAGPLVAVLDDLPAVSLTGVVLANELLDNLPVALLERTEDGWAEVRVGADHRGELVEVLVGASSQSGALAGELAPAAPPGARIPLQRAATAWLRQVLSSLDRGRLIALDYADTTASMATRPCDEWLRTYRAHARGGPPLARPGSQDITCEVAVDQLVRAHRPRSEASQADWLRAHGIDDLVAAARATWHERAAIGDLAALRARSAVGEAEALTDPAGLGAFRVLEWQVGQ
ncbi:MAG TPA: SAM-dependent methyltransferase [Acidimicrobiales bacterium]|nr:SAM-dependent methyltransferase [Acidimicrobiales bacterium]